MATIEIREGIKIGFDDLLNSVSNLDTETLNSLMDRLNQVLSSRQPNEKSEQEADLLKQIKEIIPTSVLRRYRQLYTKQQNDSITTREREEICMLTDYMEEKSAERVLLLALLADLRNVPLTDLAKQLRLQNFYA